MGVLRRDLDHVLGACESGGEGLSAGAALAADACGLVARSGVAGAAVAGEGQSSRGVEELLVQAATGEGRVSGTA